MEMEGTMQLGVRALYNTRFFSLYNYLAPLLHSTLVKMGTASVGKVRYSAIEQLCNSWYRTLRYPRSYESIGMKGLLLCNWSGSNLSNHLHFKVCIGERD